MILCLAVAALLLAACSTAGEWEDWFPWQPEEDFRPSVIDAGELLDAPAGKHGFVRMQEGRFVFEDGTPVKFWGTNICWDDPACSKEVAERWTRFMAKYGVNCIRLHKFTNPGSQGIALGGDDSTTMDPEKLDRMDYFVHRLREKGIYYGWSPIFRHEVQPGECDQLLAYDEVAAWHEETSWGDSGLVNFARDLQEIHVALLVGLLKHHNPYSGLRYAEDPALAFVEIQNEDDIFWPATERAVEACPTYRRLLCSIFSEWLRRQYGTEAALRQAWGEAALGEESLADCSVYPAPSCEHYTPQALAESPLGRKRLLDQARFLYETQNNYYSRVARSIRATGYRGPLIGSCWQAGHSMPHYYNLHSDALVGFIDRHNYYGRGAGRHRMAPGPMQNPSMLARAGSALLSVGMQQVAERPFAFSEWICVLPDEWGAETAPLVAAYGMGLQNWDASYEFCSRTSEHLWWDTLSAGGNVYNVDSPLHLGQYPVLARMIRRGDVAPGQPVAVRRICVPAFQEGGPDIDERVEQEGDVKVFRGEIPSEALAVGRVLIEFTEEPREHERADLDQWWDPSSRLVRSNTGQLTWQYGERGLVIVDTPCTQGVVGFGGGRRFDLDGTLIELESPFASLLVTSLDYEQGIADSPHLLISAVARARNTGMEWNQDHTELVSVGGPPLLIEPVEATITLKGRNRVTVWALDHAGRRTDTRVPTRRVAGGAAFTLGGQYATIYYEVVA